MTVLLELINEIATHCLLIQYFIHLETQLKNFRRLDAIQTIYYIICELFKIPNLLSL